MNRSWPAGTSALDIINSLGLEVRIEWPADPIPTERDMLCRRILSMLQDKLADRYEAMDWD